MWRGRAADHPLRLGAHGKDGAGKGVDRDDGRLVQDDAAAANVDERVRGPEVDRHVATKEPEDPLRPLGTGRGGRRTLNPLGHGFRWVIQQDAIEGWQPRRERNHGPVTGAGARAGTARLAGHGVRRCCSRGRDRSSPGWRIPGRSTRPAPRCWRRPRRRSGATWSPVPRRGGPGDHRVRPAGAAGLRRRGVPRCSGRRADDIVGVGRAFAGRVRGARRGGRRSGSPTRSRWWWSAGEAMQRAGEERPGAMSALLGVGAEDASVLCEDVRGRGRPASWRTRTLPRRSSRADRWPRSSGWRRSRRSGRSARSACPWRARSTAS